jgi:hypothetical protein
MNNEAIIESAITVAEMARRLEMSRARLYQLIGENVMLPPVYSLRTRKPFYIEEITQRNLEVKRRNIGINGQIILFYSTRNLPLPATKKIRKPKTILKPTVPPHKEHSQLLDDLKALGLGTVTATQVESVLKICYPTGISEVDENEVLRTVFREIKRQNTELNVRTKSTLNAQ